MPAVFPVSLIVWCVAIAGVIAGVRLSVVQTLARGLVAVSGGILMAVAGFWILPDLARFFGWPLAIAWVAAGFAALWLTNRYVHPVCPSCSHTHDHDRCSTRLHGFAGPMLTVAAVHSFLDGWILTAGGAEGSKTLAAGVVLGIAAHKFPEGMALGILVRASLRGMRPAIVSLVLVQALTVVGALAAYGLAPVLGLEWAHALLAIAGGSFLFLGYHAIHSEYKRTGVAPMVRLFGSRLFHL